MQRLITAEHDDYRWHAYPRQSDVAPFQPRQALGCRCPSLSTAYYPSQRCEREERHDAGGDPDPPPTPRVAWLAQQVVERAAITPFERFWEYFRGSPVRF